MSHKLDNELLFGIVKYGIGFLAISVFSIVMFGFVMGIPWIGYIIAGGAVIMFIHPIIYHFWWIDRKNIKQ